MIQKFLTGIDAPWFLQCAVCTAVGVCVYFLLKLIFRTEKGRRRLCGYPDLSLLFTAVIGFCQLEIANHNVFPRTMPLLNIGINILTLFAFLEIIYILCNRAWLAIIVGEVITAVLGVANYYTLYFRGTPVTAQDIPSIRTALNVSSDLKFTLQIVASFLLLVTVCSIMYAWFLRRCETVHKRNYKGKAVRAAISLTFLWFIYASSCSPKPANTSAWIWRDQYWKYGYTACSIESVQRALHIIEKPEGYTTESALEKMESYEKTLIPSYDFQKPDIILILNETLFDFSLIHDFETNEPVMPYMDSLKNVIRGYVSVPTIGGGTNRSEYELLTSNSLSLMKDILPFWSLDLKDANSISSVLQQQGYYTMAFHQGIRGNYNRDKKYPEMGFDDVWFEDDMESYELVHGNISDKSGYEFLIEKYEQRDKNKPFFAYNLTIQNHISYRTNIDITVYPVSGFEGMEEQASIYLSCLRESDNAFRFLTEYFSQVENPVIICMVGDHGPDYAATVAKKAGLDKKVQKYGEKCTPLIIWSNYGLKDENWGITSMPYVVPRLLRTAGVEESPYYRYVCELSEEIPILTAYDSYCDRNGVDYRYSDITEFSQQILDYWYFEYYNVHEKEKKSNTFFQIGR